MQLNSFTSNLEREHNALLDSLGNLVRNKVPVLSIFSTVLCFFSQCLLLLRVFIEAFLKIVEVIVDVVIFVHIDIVLGWRSQPILVNDSLAPRVKLNELLELEIGASVSVCQPIDRLLLDYQTEEHGSHWEVIVILPRITFVLMNSNIFIEASEESDVNAVV